MLQRWLLQGGGVGGGERPSSATAAAAAAAADANSSRFEACQRAIALLKGVAALLDILLPMDHHTTAAAAAAAAAASRGGEPHKLTMCGVYIGGGLHTPSSAARGVLPGLHAWGGTPVPLLTPTAAICLSSLQSTACALLQDDLVGAMVNAFTSDPALSESLLFLRHRVRSAAQEEAAAPNWERVVVGLSSELGGVLKASAEFVSRGLVAEVEAEASAAASTAAASAAAAAAASAAAAAAAAAEEDRSRGAGGGRKRKLEAAAVAAAAAAAAAGTGASHSEGSAHKRSAPSSGLVVASLGAGYSQAVASLALTAGLGGGGALRGRRGSSALEADQQQSLSQALPGFEAEDQQQQLEYGRSEEEEAFDFEEQMHSSGGGGGGGSDSLYAAPDEEESAWDIGGKGGKSSGGAASRVADSQAAQECLEGVASCLIDILTLCQPASAAAGRPVCSPAPELSTLVPSPHARDFATHLRLFCLASPSMGPTPTLAAALASLLLPSASAPTLAHSGVSALAAITSRAHQGERGKHPLMHGAEAMAPVLASQAALAVAMQCSSAGAGAGFWGTSVPVCEPPLSQHHYADLYVDCVEGNLGAAASAAWTCVPWGGELAAQPSTTTQVRSATGASLALALAYHLGSGAGALGTGGKGGPLVLPVARDRCAAHCALLASAAAVAAPPEALTEAVDALAGHYQLCHQWAVGEEGRRREKEGGGVRGGGGGGGSGRVTKEDVMLSRPAVYPSRLDPSLDWVLYTILSRGANSGSSRGLTRAAALCAAPQLLTAYAVDPRFFTTRAWRPDPSTIHSLTRNFSEAVMSSLGEGERAECARALAAHAEGSLEWLGCPLPPLLAVDVRAACTGVGAWGWVQQAVPGGRELGTSSSAAAAAAAAAAAQPQQSPGEAALLRGLEAGYADIPATPFLRRPLLQHLDALSHSDGAAEERRHAGLWLAGSILAACPLEGNSASLALLLRSLPGAITGPLAHVVLAHAAIAAAGSGSGSGGAGAAATAPSAFFAARLPALAEAWGCLGLPIWSLPPAPFGYACTRDMALANVHLLTATAITVAAKRRLAACVQGVAGRPYNGGRGSAAVAAVAGSSGGGGGGGSASGGGAGKPAATSAAAAAAAAAAAMDQDVTILEEDEEEGEMGSAPRQAVPGKPTPAAATQHPIGSAAFSRAQVAALYAGLVEAKESSGLASLPDFSPFLHFSTSPLPLQDTGPLAETLLAMGAALPWAWQGSSPPTTSATKPARSAAAAAAAASSTGTPWASSQGVPVHPGDVHAPHGPARELLQLGIALGLIAPWQGATQPLTPPHSGPHPLRPSSAAWPARPFCTAWPAQLGGPCLALGPPQPPPCCCPPPPLTPSPTSCTTGGLWPWPRLRSWLLPMACPRCWAGQRRW